MQATAIEGPIYLVVVHFNWFSESESAYKRLTVIRRSFLKTWNQFQQL